MLSGNSYISDSYVCSSKNGRAKGMNEDKKPFNRNEYERESEGLWDIKKQKQENQLNHST